MTKGQRLEREMHMTKAGAQDETTRVFVKRFCEQVLWLKQVHDIVCELFDDESAQSLMERTAHVFFQDLSNIVIHYFLLEVMKVTDPATGVGGKRENLTVANLIETVEWPPDCLQDLERLNATVQSFRGYVKPARDRILAHNDKTTVKSGEVLGAFPKGGDKELLAVLEQICDLMHRAAFGEIFGEMTPYYSSDVRDIKKKMLHSGGDVRDFKKALQMAIAFDTLLSDSTGDDRARLHRLLLDVMSRPAYTYRPHDAEDPGTSSS